MTRIGVIAEDSSDIEVIKELIKKLKSPSSFCVRHFVGNGCSLCDAQRETRERNVIADDQGRVE